MKSENTQALAKQNELLKTEIELPLTVEEKLELQECEYRIQEAKDLAEKVIEIITERHSLCILEN